MSKSVSRGTMQAHGFVWPKGLPTCSMCGRDANDQIHVTPGRAAQQDPYTQMPRGMGGGQFAYDRTPPKMPIQVHPYMMSSPTVANSVTCQQCGNALNNGIHAIGLPSGAMPISSNSGLYGAGGGLTSTFAKETAFVAEIGNRLVFAAPATTDFSENELPRELAAQWEKAQQDNPYYTWIAGRYVEADRPNRNHAYWSTADLEVGEPTVAHGPINWLHEEKHIIGAIASSQMVHVDQQRADDTGVGNHIVMLGAIWQHIYPNEADVIQRASDNGKLWASMECVSREVSCLVCQKAMTYSQYMHQDNRCDHMREGMPRRFIDPTFGGAGIIVPPVRPGWANADVRVMQGEAAALVERQAASFDGLSTQEAENLVTQILLSAGSLPSVDLMQDDWTPHALRDQIARDFTADERKKHVKEGNAMADGSYPIVTQEDLNNAWNLRGKSKHYSTEQIEAHCRSAAKKHGLKMPGDTESE
jgi:hypothetical protein